jgi:GH43 family beta-xylosidase
MSFSFLSRTYHNPVVARDFPDPFILKFGNRYWAYGTGFAPDGRCFAILTSTDLVTWEPRMGAMEPLSEGYPCYWAPEVSYYNGVFYLYYSVGDEATMQIRVATAPHPEGPFIDSGHRLTPEPFAIDPHIAGDHAGNRYLFYATDFLNHSHIGTGTVRARLQDPFTLAEAAVPVTRAKYEWQVYHPNRPEKGGVRWHTVEGPFVLHHKGIYYQMFSGGNWQNPSYGVSYAISPTLDNPQEWEQAADGTHVLPILRSLPEQGIIGPGHNSVVRGPDNRQWYCIYHRWAADGSGRQMAIDPLEWVGKEMVLDGPSHAPCPAPLLPTDVEFRVDIWNVEKGEWQFHNNRLIQKSMEGVATVTSSVDTACFMAELLLCADHVTPQGYIEITLTGANGSRLSFRFLPTVKQLEITSALSGVLEVLPLPDGFEPTSFHPLRLEVNHRHVSFTFGSPEVRWEGGLDETAQAIRLTTFSTQATFSDLAITKGWEDGWQTDAPPEVVGWQPIVPSEVPHAWRIESGALVAPFTPTPTTISKGELNTAYEAVITLKLLEIDSKGRVTIEPLWHPTWEGAQLHICKDTDGWQVSWGNREHPRPLELPSTFDPTEFQQFRFRKEQGWLMVDWQGARLVETAIPPLPTTIALTAVRAAFVVDMVRFTVIPTPPDEPPLFHP